MLMQRLANRGLFLGAMFDEALRRNPYQRITLDHPLDVAPKAGTDLSVYHCALLVVDLAAALHDLHVRPGEKVVIYKQDAFDILLLACAVSRAGGIPVPLSPSLPGDTVVELVRRVGRPHLITDERTLMDRLPTDIGVHTTGIALVAGQAAGATSLRPVHDEGARPLPGPSPDRPALITHTSGTTDLPKLVVHSARTLEARYRPQAAAARLLIRQRETVAMHISFVHSRLITVLAIALRRGFPMIIVRDPAAERVAELFATHRPGILEAHPNAFIEWEALATDSREPLANVKYVSSTFDAIHPRTVAKLLAASRRSQPIQLQLYGQSEVGPAVGRATKMRHAGKVNGRCVGFPFPGMTTIRIVARGGKQPSAQTPGHIEVRTDGRALTYLGEEVRFLHQLNDGWWRMGDVGYRTKSGCLHISDREVDLIPEFGSALEVEDILMSRIDTLREVVLIATEHQAPTPVVVTKDGSVLDHALWRAATADLPEMLPPVQMEMDDIPRTATLKVRRRELSAMPLLQAKPPTGER